MLHWNIRKNFCLILIIKTCDSFSPKIFKKYPKEVYAKILEWIKSDKPYVVRYGIGLLLSNYLDEYFDVSHLELVSDIRLMSIM